MFLDWIYGPPGPDVFLYIKLIDNILWDIKVFNFEVEDFYSFSFIVCVFGFYLENSPISLVYKYFTPVPCCFDCYGLVVKLTSEHVNPLTLFIFNRSILSSSLKLPVNLRMTIFTLIKKQGFDKDGFASWSLPIHEHYVVEHLLSLLKCPVVKFVYCSSPWVSMPLGKGQRLWRLICWRQS